MSNKLIRDALDAQLKTLSGSTVPIAFENKQFIPVIGKAYLDVTLLPATTLNPSYGAVHKRENGVYRIIVNFPAGNGPAAAMAWAENLRFGFKRGTTLTSGDVTVRIMRDPYIAPALPQPDWYSVPVSVPYQADVFE